MQEPSCLGKKNFNSFNFNFHKGKSIWGLSEGIGVAAGRQAWLDTQGGGVDAEGSGEEGGESAG